MTLCVGIQRTGCVDVHTDSLITGSEGPYEYSEKVFRAHGVFWATAGDAPLDQYLRSVRTRAYTPSVKLPFDVWFTRELAGPWSEMRRQLNPEASCSALVVVRGELWELSEGLYLSKPSRGYCCVGSGAQYAYGAFGILADHLGSSLWDDSKQVVEDVFHVVSGLLETVGGDTRSYEGVV